MGAANGVISGKGSGAADFSRAVVDESWDILLGSSLTPGVSDRQIKGNVTHIMATGGRVPHRRILVDINWIVDGPIVSEGTDPLLGGVLSLILFRARDNCRCFADAFPRRVGGAFAFNLCA